MAADSGVKARRSTHLAEIEMPLNSTMTTRAMRNKAKKLDLAFATKDLSEALVHAQLCHEDGFIDEGGRGPASPDALAVIVAACGVPPDEAVGIASGPRGDATS